MRRGSGGNAGGRQSCSAGTTLCFAASMFAAKFVLATSRRSLYPFAPEVARATGVSDQRLANVLAGMQAAYCLVPMAVPTFTRRVGTAATMVGANIITACAQLAMGLLPGLTFDAFAVGVACFGVGKGLFDPSLAMTIRERFPEARRAYITSIIELSWGTSSLIGIPVSGYLLAAGWRLPFLCFGVLCALAAGLVAVALRGGCAEEAGTAGKNEHAMAWIRRIHPLL